MIEIDPKRTSPSNETQEPPRRIPQFVVPAISGIATLGLLTVTAIDTIKAFQDCGWSLLTKPPKDIHLLAVGTIVAAAATFGTLYVNRDVNIDVPRRK